MDYQSLHIKKIKERLKEMHAANVVTSLRNEPLYPSSIEAELAYERMLIDKYSRPCGCPRDEHECDCRRCILKS